ncbi:MAG TPA: helix-turn-helix transcriptional regulator [Oculatellaceae cyanobacterium]
MDTRARIAERIKEARKMAGLTQAQVAKLLNVPRPSISEAEAGNRKVSAEEILEMSKLFEVSVSWLMGEGEDQIDIRDSKLELAARELNKLKGDDLTRILKLLASIQEDEEE